MDTRSIRIAPTALVLALLWVPIQARAGDGPTDCHEIPAFVLERTEIRSAVDASAPVAGGPTAAGAALAGAGQ